MRLARPILRLTPLMLALGASACGDDRNAPSPPSTPPAGATHSSDTTAPSPAPSDHTMALTGEPLRTDRLAGGVVIDVFTEGDGRPLGAGQTGVIDFEMRLADGTVLDSSARRHAPLRVPLTKGSAVPGLLEGLEGMKVGETRRLHVPSDLGYGDVGRPPIPPRADLVFDVTLLEIIETQ